MTKFIGRKEELAKLKGLLKKKSASFVVVRGRRRIGKSRLIQEFGKGMKSLFFSGIPPTHGITDQIQRDEFASQMSLTIGMPLVKSQNWNELFWHLSQQVKTGRILIVLDEISWIGSEDPDFLGKLKNAWDLHFSRNPGLILIVCGSISSWIDENILSSTGFLGRVSLDLVLKELPLRDCRQFWDDPHCHISSYEIFKVLSVTGGIPKYLEEILPSQSAEENIRRLCFQPEGLLFREFDQIFSDLFSKKSTTFGYIVRHLTDGASDLDTLCKALEWEKGGKVSGYLHELVETGFVAEDVTWNIKTTKTSRLKKYRISDNYVKFYLKYVEPNKEMIINSLFSDKALTSLPGWNAMMGFQFENLILNNYHKLLEVLNINPSEIVKLGPFFQRPSKRNKGCQIDLLIQTNYLCVYLCEIKFYASEVNKKHIADFPKKMSYLSLPKGISKRSVLIHVNGVSSSVIESGIFDYLIDFSEFLV